MAELQVLSSRALSRPKFTEFDTVAYCGGCKSVRLFTESDAALYAREWPVCCGEPVVLMSGGQYEDDPSQFVDSMFL